jgi:hypothetical protein
MKTSIGKTLLSLLLASIFMISSINAYAQEQEKEKKEKPIRIKWETIEGIIKFMVQIKDLEDKTVLDRTVNTSYIDFVLPPGKYKIRIGAINKFEKISFWTDWEDVEIRKSIRSRFFTNDFAAKVGLKISGGVSYNMLLSPWNTQYRNTSFKLKYLNYMYSIGFHFGNSQYIKPKNFLRFTGIELEGSYCNYAGIDRIDFKSKLLNILAGPAFFIKTQLKIPLNFYFRFGGGAAYSKQEYTKLIFKIPVDGEILTLDPYVKVGGAMELNFLFALSLNIGVDYYVIFYRDKFFQSLRYYAMLGIRI